MVSGLVPSDIFDMMVEQSSAQFNQTVVWIQQAYDSNGHPIEDDSGEKVFKAPQTIPGRAITVFREFLDEGGYHRVQVTEWHLPPHTGVRYGDSIYGVGDDPTNSPPIMSVSEIPDPEFATEEVVTTGWRSKGAP